MAKDKITEYDATANNNTVCGDVNIAENSALPSDMNNFAREIMSHLKEGLGSGTPLYVDQTNNRVGINKTPTVALDVSGSLSVDGGTIKLDGNYPTGSNNVALGNDALISGSLSGGANTAIGNSSLYTNTSGAQNVAVGNVALYTNSTGIDNTAVGANSMQYSTTGSYNTALGRQSLWNNTTASSNTAVGYHAGYSNSTGSPIVAMGYYTLDQNTTGVHNNAYGYRAMRFNTTGGYNTAVGGDALYSNTTASNNTAVGYQALTANTTGASNIAVGTQALNSNTTANNNNALGYRALYNNQTGTQNNAFGMEALYNTTASDNTAMGQRSGYAITTGSDNSSFGSTSLFTNTTGSYNTAIGRDALRNNTTASSNTAVGYQALFDNTTGQNNTIIGRSAGANITTASGNTFIGKGAGESVTTGAKNTIIGLFNGNQGGLDIRTSSNNIVLSDGDGNPRLTINSEGRVAVGETAGTYSGKFTVNSAISNNGACILNANASDFSASVIDLNTLRNTTNGSYFFLSASITGIQTKVRVQDSGNFLNVNNSYGALSDEKLKENIADASSQWNDIKAIKVRKYSMKEDNLGSANKIGVIAQELETAGLNNLVEEIYEEARDTNEFLEDGVTPNPNYWAIIGKEETPTKTVKYSILYMKAVKALQEAMTRIEILEAKVTALENV